MSEISCKEVRKALVEKGKKALYAGQFSNAFGEIKRTFSPIGNHWRNCSDCHEWWNSISPDAMTQKVPRSEQDMSFESA